MPDALVPLQNITLSGSQATVTFSNIPTTGFRDLRLIVNAYGPGGDNSFCRFNGDTGGNYPQVYMYGNGSGTGSSQASWAEQYLGTLGTARTTNTLDILDAFASDKHKTTLVRGSDTTAYVQARAGRWASTSAITSIAVTCGGTYSAGSTFALYGVVA